MDTSLSPRLRHLLIQEDKRTGRLIQPYGSSATPTITIGSLSPPISPTSIHPSPSPIDSLPSSKALPSPIPPPPSSAGLGNGLPRLSLSLPRPSGDRRASGSILSLINELSVQSPPSSASSDHSSFRLEQERAERDRDRERERERDRERHVQMEMERDREDRRRSSSGSVSAAGSSSSGLPTSASASLSMSHSASSSASATSSTPRPPTSSIMPTPLSAPLSTVHQPPFFESRRSVNLVQQPYGPRPDMMRRHSSHPYEYNPASRPVPTGYAPAPPYPAAVPVIGARAPISRTTKACNACRARKVRCDAGGLGNGETGPCSRCREAGVECVYTGVQKKRGPCPGTARPSVSRARRASSQRGSVASAYPTTPPEDHAQQPWRPTPAYYSYDGAAAWTSLPPRDSKAAPPPHAAHPPYPHARPPPPPGPAPIERRYSANPSSHGDLRSWEPSHGHPHAHPYSRAPTPASSNSSAGPTPVPALARSSSVSGWGHAPEPRWEEREREAMGARDERSVFAKDYTMRAYEHPHQHAPSPPPGQSVAPSRRMSQNPAPPQSQQQQPHPHSDHYRHSTSESRGPSPAPRQERQPSFGKDMNSLPPLRVAIRRSDSYYEP